MRRALLVAFAVLLLAASTAAAVGPTVLVPHNGPEAPVTTEPTTVLVPFDHDVWSFTEGARSRTVTIPDDGWNRAIVRFTVDPATDPWDRLFGIAIGGAEVLHGTTPRAAMTIERDITAYSEAFPRGEDVPVQLYFGTWVGKQILTVELLFYDDATAPLVEQAHDEVVSPFLFRGLAGPGGSVTTTTAFPEDAAATGVVELTFSGHAAQGEFWYQYGGPPTFHILVDGETIGQVTAMPYVYALLGFSGGSVVINTVHSAMWWTGQQALDVAGVHTGTGEIPAYRANLSPEQLELLTGARTVEIVTEGGSGGYWPASLTFLLDE